MIDQWKWSHNIMDELYSKAPCNEEGILVFNLPDNFNGVFMFRDYSDSNAWEDHIQMYQEDCQDFEVAIQHNIKKKSDAISFKKISSHEFEIEFEQWGNWWLMKGLGAQQKKKEHYTITPNGQKSTLQLNEGHPYKTIYYCDNKTWHKLALH